MKESIVTFRRYGMRQMGAGARWATLTIFGAAMVVACRPGDDQATRDTGILGTPAAPGLAPGTMTQAQALGTLAAVHQAEVEAGQFAQQRATNAQVRQYAQMITSEHQAFNQRLQALGQNVDASQADQELVRMHQETMNRLRNLPQGAAFDTAFINAEVRIHEAALERADEIAEQEWARGAGTATSPATPAQQAQPGQAAQPEPLDQHIRNTRELIQRHLDRGREIQRQLGG